jgi:hypothetical protein
MALLFAQEEDVVFSVKQPAKPEPIPPTIIRYHLNLLSDALYPNPADSFKLYILEKEMKFEYFKRKESRGSEPVMPPELAFSTISFTRSADTLLLCLPKNKNNNLSGCCPIGGATLDKRYKNTVSWLGLIRSVRLGDAYDYSLCTDTSANVVVAGVTIPCYKTEGHFKSPPALGMYRIKVHCTTWISKKELLPVKQITESQVIQLHMAIHFPPAQRRAWKKKRVEELIAQNWIQK